MSVPLPPCRLGTVCQRWYFEKSNELIWCARPRPLAQPSSSPVAKQGLQKHNVVFLPSALVEGEEDQMRHHANATSLSAPSSSKRVYISKGLSRGGVHPLPHTLGNGGHFFFRHFVPE